ncbi:hypothetical protein FRB94_012701 [Tulasnella sp. JGI-2019a]|nr:hypothetical protein FRB94_012701 [Tulasnella sp. JGI-2019a]
MESKVSYKAVMLTTPLAEDKAEEQQDEAQWEEADTTEQMTEATPQPHQLMTSARERQESQKGQKVGVT